MPNLTKAEADLLIRMELRQWGFPPDAYEWTEATEGNGIAWVYASHVKVYLTEKVLASAALLTEVIKHEVAHLLDFKERGLTEVSTGTHVHGASWKKWCRIVGCRARKIIPV
jgi:predicted SprT family Zn-dependent metalloprotease